MLWQRRQGWLGRCNGPTGTSGSSAPSAAICSSSTGSVTQPIPHTRSAQRSPNPICLPGEIEADSFPIGGVGGLHAERGTFGERNATPARRLVSGGVVPLPLHGGGVPLGELHAELQRRTIRHLPPLEILAIPGSGVGLVHVGGWGSHRIHGRRRRIGRPVRRDHPFADVRIPHHRLA